MIQGDQKRSEIFSGSKFLAKFVRKLFVFDNFLRKIKIILLGQPVLYGDIMDGNGCLCHQ